MSENTGTVERLALTLAEALAPLEDDLAAGNVDSLLRQLGLELPDSLRRAARAHHRRADRRHRGRCSFPRTGRRPRDRHRERHDVAPIVSAGAGRLTDVEAVVSAIDTLATQLPGALARGRHPGAAAAFAGQFADRLLSYSLVRWLEGAPPDRRSRALGLAGVVDRMPLPNTGGTGTHLSRRIRLDRHRRRSSATRTTPCAPSSAGATPAFDGRELLRRLADLAPRPRPHRRLRRRGHPAGAHPLRRDHHPDRRPRRRAGSSSR